MRARPTNATDRCAELCTIVLAREHARRQPQQSAPNHAKARHPNDFCKTNPSAIPAVPISLSPRVLCVSAVNLSTAHTRQQKSTFSPRRRKTKPPRHPAAPLRLPAATAPLAPMLLPSAVVKRTQPLLVSGVDLASLTVLSSLTCGFVTGRKEIRWP